MIKVIFCNIKVMLYSIGFAIGIFFIINHYGYKNELNSLFKNHILSIMGIMLPIIFSGLAQAHFALNKIEEKKNTSYQEFEYFRLDFKISIHVLLIAFFVSIICWLLINKENACDCYLIAYLTCFILFCQYLREIYFKILLEIPAIK